MLSTHYNIKYFKNDTKHLLNLLLHILSYYNTYDVFRKNFMVQSLTYLLNIQRINSVYHISQDVSVRHTATNLKKKHGKIMQKNQHHRANPVPNCKRMKISW